MNTNLAPDSVGALDQTANSHLPSASAADWFTAREIALAFNTNKVRIRRIAEREKWPCREIANRVEFQPPAQVADVVIKSPAHAAKKVARENVTVRFSDLAHSDAQREKVLLREAAVKMLQNNLHLGKETALQLVVQHFATGHPLFNISISSLRRWDEGYAAHGVDGLVEQKRGRVGCKPFAADLESSALLQAAADAVEHGIKGRLNVARAFRNLTANPTIEGPARNWLHGARASKSSYPPSFGDAIRKAVPPLATRYIQQGPRAAKLDGPYTECSYENVPAGKAWTADDMTANVYVWIEWPNEQGFILIRPQILALMDVSSMMWLIVRAVIRSKGQYNKDDVWGLIGDKMDAYGLHRDEEGRVDEIAVLEGGTWQSGVVVGAKTGLSDEERFGGLRALGVKVVHTRTPRGKIIETAFNNLQHAADNCRGYCGRMEMKDQPEHVKSQIARVRAGHAHPREFFMHFHEYTQHIAGVMNALNHERNDGKILQGRAPVDKWTEDAPKMLPMPEHSKWMYRAAYRIVQVTSNGVRISVGSGKFQTHYTYSNPAVLEQHRGRTVCAFWNDYDPDTDAVIYTVKTGKPDKYLCVAPRLRELNRFGASDEEMQREATRKKLAMQTAVTASKAVAPFLQRGNSARRATYNPHTQDIAARIAAAREAALKKQQARAKQARVMRDVEVPEEIRNAGIRPARSQEISDAEMNEILGDHPLK